MSVHLTLSEDDAKELADYLSGNDMHMSVGDRLLLSRRIYNELNRRWKPGHNQEAVCACGHAYHRHFDTYDDMEPVGCKYCPCSTFKEAE